MNGVRIAPRADQLPQINQRDQGPADLGPAQNMGRRIGKGRDVAHRRDMAHPLNRNHQHLIRRMAGQIGAFGPYPLRIRGVIRRAAHFPCL